MENEIITMWAKDAKARAVATWDVKEKEELEVYCYEKENPTSVHRLAIKQKLKTRTILEAGIFI